MALEIEWSPPVGLIDGAREKLIYLVPLDELPDRDGVYVFGRRFDKSFEALYVGMAISIRARVKNQLNNLRLMKHLKDAKSGKRVVLAGEFIGKPGQRPEICLPLIERALIRHFVAEGHDLVNKQGVLLRQHEIVSSGYHPKRYIPSKIFLEK